MRAWRIEQPAPRRLPGFPRDSEGGSEQRRVLGEQVVPRSLLRLLSALGPLLLMLGGTWFRAPLVDVDLASSIPFQEAASPGLLHQGALATARDLRAPARMVRRA